MTQTETPTRTPWGGARVRSMDAEPVIVQAGLDWTVTKDKLFTPLGQEATRHRGIIREDTSEILGIVGKNYTPIQNKDAFRFLDTLAHDGLMEYEGAGALNGGRRIFMVAKLPGELLIKGVDPTHKYLLLSNAHDGSGAFRVLPTAIRLWCQNMLMATLRAGAGTGISIRHSAGAEVAMADAHLALKLANKQFEDYGRLANVLADAQLSVDGFEAFLDATIPSQVTKAGRVSMRTENIRDSVTSLFEGGGVGSTEAAVRGTAYGALQALVEFDNYARSTTGPEEGRQLKRFESSLLGSSHALHRKAVNALVEITGVAAPH